MQGTVTRVLKHSGYGFIDKDIFFRITDEKKGDRVEFDVERRESGHLVAVNVKKL